MNNDSESSRIIEHERTGNRIEEIQLYKAPEFITINKYSSFQMSLFVISFILNIVLSFLLLKNILAENLTIFGKNEFYWQKKKFDLEEYFYVLRARYLYLSGSKYDENNLVTFQDKINWLIIHDSTPLKARCSDKILVHDYSKEKLGKDICNKILKIYNNVNEIDFDELPNQFAIKANHGNSYNIIVNNKTNLNITHAKMLLNRWVHMDYGDYRKEFHYSFITPKIFVEEYIGDNLKNYKLLCYGGEPRFIYVSIVDGDKKYRNFYDMDWNLLDFHCLSEPHPTYQYPKPKFFEEMKKISRILSADFKFVRVDLYELENEIRLGELTYTPMNSFFFCKNKAHEIELGKYIDTS